MSFHFSPKARLTNIERLLQIVSDEQAENSKLLHERLVQEGYEVTPDHTRRSLNLGTNLGLFELVDHAARTHKLTPRGRACRGLAVYRREVFCDVMHFLMFATWEFAGHQDHWSWSYAKVCELLWRMRNAAEIGKNKLIFGQLSAEAVKEFPESDPAVGTETVYGVKNWLRELSPPFLVMHDDGLVSGQEREWFSAELALLAVSYLYVNRSTALGTPILLDRSTLEQLCPLCLASGGTIMAMIETASRTFSYLDIHTGEWGSSAVLKQAVDIVMFT